MKTPIASARLFPSISHIIKLAAMATLYEVDGLSIKDFYHPLVFSSSYIDDANYMCRLNIKHLDYHMYC